MIFCTWARLALFSSALVADLDESRLRRTVYNLGGQVDLRLVLFWRLESMLSVGYAVCRRAGPAAVAGIYDLVEDPLMVGCEVLISF